MMLCDFWNYVDKSNGDEFCWPWLRAINKSGYGSVWINKKSKTASRVAYELSFGKIPEGEGYHGNVVMHTCDNRFCCNPKHLILGTQKENNKDRDNKNRIKNRKKGEENHHSRFTKNEVLQIKKYLKMGKSLKSVSEIFGCSKSAIAHIRHGRVWNWLNEENLPLGQAAMGRAS
jgi:hypothetical protein